MKGRKVTNVACIIALAMVLSMNVCQVIAWGGINIASIIMMIIMDFVYWYLIVKSVRVVFAFILVSRVRGFVNAFSWLANF